jgi:hypothetical protein
MDKLTVSIRKIKKQIEDEIASIDTIFEKLLQNGSATDPHILFYLIQRRQSLSEQHSLLELIEGEGA